MENEKNPLIIEMTDENGAKVKVELVRYFEDGDKNYVIANDLSNDTDCYILEIKPGENGDELLSIDDENEFARLCEVVDHLDE